MFQIYLHDMSEFMGWSADADGTLELPDGLLPPYWERDDHWPYFVYSEDSLIGFSMVRHAPDTQGVNDMGQFFYHARQPKERAWADRIRENRAIASWCMASQGTCR